MPVPIREHFDRPERLSPVWTLQKADKTASCTAWSHWSGWELRLMIDEQLSRTQVCRSAREIADVQEQWRAGLEARGWRLT